MSRESEDFHAVREAKVCFFDDIKVGRAGEYVVRGKGEKASFNEGYYEPGRNVSVQVF